MKNDDCEEDAGCKKCGTTDMVGCTHLKRGWVCQFCHAKARTDRAKTIIGAIVTAANVGHLKFVQATHNQINLKFGNYTKVRITIGRFLGEPVLNVVIVEDEEANNGR